MYLNCINAGGKQMSTFCVDNILSISIYNYHHHHHHEELKTVRKGGNGPATPTAEPTC